MILSLLSVGLSILHRWRTRRIAYDGNWYGALGGPSYGWYPWGFFWCGMESGMFAGVTTSGTTVGMELPSFLIIDYRISMIRLIWVFRWLISTFNASWSLRSSSMVTYDMLLVQDRSRVISFDGCGSFNKRPSDDEFVGFEFMKCNMIYEWCMHSKILFIIIFIFYLFYF